MRVYARRAAHSRWSTDWALALFSVALIGGIVLLLHATRHPTCCRRWTKAASSLDYIMPAGSSLEDTNRVVTHVEKILRATPEVESTSRRTGLQLGPGAR